VGTASHSVTSAMGASQAAEELILLRIPSRMQPPDGKAGHPGEVLQSLPWLLRHLSHSSSAPFASRSTYGGNST